MIAPSEPASSTILPSREPSTCSGAVEVPSSQPTLVSRAECPYLEMHWPVARLCTCSTCPAVTYVAECCKYLVNPSELSTSI